VAVSREARRLGRWNEAVGGLSVASAILGERDPDAASQLLDEAETLAEARGLAEQLAWIGLARTATALKDGAWDAGVAAAHAGLDLAERFGYDRAAVRTWFALTPLADARGDRATLERAAMWIEGHRASFPHSPYGAVQHAAVELRLADAGLGAPPALDDETLLAGLALDDDSPEWLAATERIVEATIAGGRLDLARTMVERLPAAGSDDARALDRASRALIGSLLAGAEAPGSGVAAAVVRDALRHAREAGAPWWISRSIRLLDAHGTATPDELAEMTTIEGRLGISH
jgi:hypothetical protein